MIKIAFLKFGGLAAGGTEKYLQTLACNLPKDQFDVYYFYTDAAPLIGNSWKHPDTDKNRKEYMEKNNIKLIHVSCEARDDRYGPPYRWVNTNLFNLFREEEYDILQTGRSGYLEFPFCDLKNISIVDSIHGCGENGTFTAKNVKKTVLLSNTQITKWLKNGGSEEKISLISPLIEFPKSDRINLRKFFDIDENKFIFGMHQGNRDDIFSEIPLKAYKQIENENTMYLLLGGSDKYKKQAEELNIKNIKFLNFTGDAEKINDFVYTLDVFAHGRLDGEVCSAAIIEALRYGKPIISHPGFNMGHEEQIFGCGFMSNTLEEYSKNMKLLSTNQNLYDILSKNCKQKYESVYNLEKNINKYIQLYKGVLNEKQ